MYSLDKIVKKTLKNPSICRNKNVILRVCLNLTKNDNGEYADLSRLEDAVKSIEYIYNQANKILIIAHQGRPKAFDEEYSLKPIINLLLKKLNKSFNKDYEILDNISKIHESKSKLIFLENIRFFNGEESKDHKIRKEFAKKLSSGFHLYINDAFADYRISASTYEIAKILPSYIGLNYFEEIKNLIYLKRPQKPFIAVVGGFKISEKIDLINKLVKSADFVLIGGAMSYTILKAMDINVGKSFVEEEMLSKVNNIIKNYSKKAFLPYDHLEISDFDKKEINESKYTHSINISKDHYGIDIGPKTIAEYTHIISSAKTILFNGPMGVSEWKKSSKGTYEILDAIIKNKKAKKYTGGGDTLATLKEEHIKNFTYISKGGGAMLSFIADEKFPTLDAIL